MAIANLIAYNAIEHNTKSASVQLSGSPEDVVQLIIGQYKYTFNADGKLVVETRIDSCINLNNHASCAQLIGSTCIPTCEPTQYKTED